VENKKLEGKVAIITGGSSGIGLATAKLFCKEGAKVVITGRNQEQLDSAASELGVTGIRSDVSNLDDINNLYNEVKAKFGNIDILFLNAGIASFIPLENANEEHFDSIMNINVKGLYFGVQKALPFLNEKASIILTSSVVNKMGMAGASVYSASKAAVRSLARTMSAELIEKGIRVNVISPGPVETPIFSKVGMSEEQMAGMKEQISQQNPMKRFGKPEEIATAALFLASEDSSYMLGAEINIDGGFTQL
jgi:NAD(P)-dependent dehydrogenase (short-subunit alcohol dehydrogenase family)